MKKGFAISLVLLVAFLFAADSFAQVQRPVMRAKTRMHRPSGRILVFLKARQEALNITSDQLEKVENLVFTFEEKMIKMRTNSEIGRLELRKMMKDRDNLDYEKIKAALSKASNNRHEMFIERIKLRKEIENVLTPEQKEKMKAMFKDRMRVRRPFQRFERSRQLPRLRDRTEK